MSLYMQIIILVIFGYLMGNISTARVISHINKQNITDVGSGNPGAMNITRNYGIVQGAITTIGDATKAAIPALLGLLWVGEIGLLAAGVAAIVGHIFPVFYAFKGGKGVSCSFGVFTILCWYISIPLFLISVISIRWVRYGAISTLSYILLSCIIFSFISVSAVSSYIMLWSIAVLVFWAHRGNIKRILTGEELVTSLEIKSGKK